LHTQPKGLCAPNPMASSVSKPELAFESTVAVIAISVHWPVADENTKQYSATVASERVPAYAGEAATNPGNAAQTATTAFIQSLTTPPFPSVPQDNGVRARFGSRPELSTRSDAFPDNGESDDVRLLSKSTRTNHSSQQRQTIGAKRQPRRLGLKHNNREEPPSELSRRLSVGASGRLGSPEHALKYPPAPIRRQTDHSISSGPAATSGFDRAHVRGDTAGFAIWGTRTLGSPKWDLFLLVAAFHRHTLGLSKEAWR